MDETDLDGPDVDSNVGFELFVIHVSRLEISRVEGHTNTANKELNSRSINVPYLVGHQHARLRSLPRVESTPEERQRIELCPIHARDLYAVPV